MAATTSDMVALNKLLEVSTPGVPHVVEHFLYFRDQSIADTALADLRRNGFRTETGLSAAGTNWLVLARHEINTFGGFDNLHASFHGSSRFEERWRVRRLGS